MLAVGRAADARRPLGAAHTFWSTFAPDSNARAKKKKKKKWGASQVTYWYAKALSKPPARRMLRNDCGRVSERLWTPGAARTTAAARLVAKPLGERELPAVCTARPLRPEIAVAREHAQGPAPNRPIIVEQSFTGQAAVRPL